MATAQPQSSIGEPTWEIAHIFPTQGMFTENSDRRGNKFWQGADLAMEVVSEDDPDRDLVDKRGEYARAEIREYWIVDPRTETVTVLSLGEPDREYTEAGNYHRGDAANSTLLDGFFVEVTQIFSVQ